MFFSARSRVWSYLGGPGIGRYPSIRSIVIAFNKLEASGHHQNHRSGLQPSVAPVVFVWHARIQKQRSLYASPGS